MSDTPQAAPDVPADAPPPSALGPAARAVQHNPQNEPGRTVPLHRFVPLHARPNVWTAKAKDKDGNPVEFSPGKTTLTFRGPTTPNDAKQAVNIILYNARHEAVRNGYEDPGFTLDEASLQPVEEQPVTDDNLGTWQPVGGVPLKLGVGLTTPKDSGRTNE